MGLTILQMVNRVESELGLPRSSTVYGASASDTSRQMGALADRTLDELRRMNRWTALQAEFNIVVQVPLTFTGDMLTASKIITNMSPVTTPLSGSPSSWAINADGLLQAARVATVDSGTQVTMTMENVNTTNVTGVEFMLMRDTYAMPSGFDWFNNRTMWDRTNRWELLGPDSPQLDQWHRSGIVATGPRRHFRKLGPTDSSFRIWPPPAEIVEPLQLVYEFLSINAVRVSGSTTLYAQYFANDDDEILLDDNALMMGIKWMFWEIKGFGAYVTLQGRWIDYVDRLIARDGAAKTLQINQRQNPIFLSPANVQDGFFPGPVSPNSS